MGDDQNQKLVVIDRGGTQPSRHDRARARRQKVRIIQTNSAGDNVHIIDPGTNKVVGVINGIEVEPRRRRVAPDGSRIYVSDEAESTLDVVDAQDAEGDRSKSR